MSSTGNSYFGSEERAEGGLPQRLRPIHRTAPKGTCHGAPYARSLHCAKEGLSLLARWHAACAPLPSHVPADERPGHIARLVQVPTLPAFWKLLANQMNGKPILEPGGSCIGAYLLRRIADIFHCFQ